MTFEHQHDEPQGFGWQFFVEVLELVPHIQDVLPGFVFVGSSEGHSAWQQHVRQNADAPDIGLWVGGFFGQKFRSDVVGMTNNGHLISQFCDAMGISKIYQFALNLEET